MPGLLAVRAMRPNSAAWEDTVDNFGSKTYGLAYSHGHMVKGGGAVAEHAHEVVAKVVEDPALYALAGKDMVCRLIMAELVLDQIVVGTQSPHAGRLRCTPLMGEMFAAMAATRGNTTKCKLAKSQEQLDASADQLRTEGRRITKSAWQL